jgi:hypothetical protein
VTTVTSDKVSITLQQINFEQSVAIVQVEFFDLDESLIRTERLELTGADFNGLNINQNFLRNYVMNHFSISQR